MYRTVVACFSTLALFILIGCGPDKKPGHDTLPVPEKNETASPHQLELVARGDHNYPPFEYLDKDGNPTGFNVEILRSIAEVMDLDLEIDLGPWQEVREQLENGEIDIITGMYKTKERDKRADFSIPHFYATYGIFVKKGSAIKDLTDLDDKEIIVQEGDLGHDYVKEAGLGKKLIIKQDWQDTLAALAAGEGDCAIVARMQGMLLINKLGLEHIVITGEPILRREYCIAVTEGDAELVAVLNAGLNIIKSSGAYDEIYNKWFGIFQREYFFTEPRIKLFLVIIAVLTASVLLVFLWVYSLRKQVRARTKELDEARSLLLAAIESTPAGVILADAPDGAIRVVNSAALEIRGEEKDVLSGVPYEQHPDYWQLYHADGSPYQSEDLPLTQAIKEGRITKNKELIIKNKKEENRWVLVSATPVRNKSGEIIAGFAVFPDITARKMAEERLMQSLKEKEVLFREVHHRVKNNLQIITSMLNLQTMNIEDEWLAEQLLTAKNRIFAMSLVHELLYQSDAIIKSNLSQYIDTLVQHIRSSYAGKAELVDIELQLDENIDIGWDQTIPIGLILHELISNAIKHAFPYAGRGTILVKLNYSSDNRLSLSVSDNGVGLPETVDLTQTGTLGMSIIYALAEQIGAEVMIETENGTHVTLEFSSDTAP
jgi:PAS domain S-box-containing protein